MSREFDQAVPLLEVENLSKSFPLSKGKKGLRVQAVNEISFSIKKGETYGLVGESGCGKTTTGKCILQIHKPTSGRIKYNGVDISKMSEAEFKHIRRDIQLIFQDPYGSLDPRQSVFKALREALCADRKARSKEEIKNRIDELLLMVGLHPSMSDRYPHEMSGGQRQRLGIARALCCSPKLIVCDEPVSALDVSIQAQIINLFKELQKELGLTYLFIAHDLSVVHHISDIICVMYLGHVMEILEPDDLYINPMHPYTKALMSAVPITDYHKERSRERIILSGEVPSPIDIPSGCPFHPRCPLANEACRLEKPSLKNVGGRHEVACYKMK